jgi:hypothetical protein
MVVVLKSWVLSKHNEEQVLGLSINSTFLNYLYDSGKISSRSVSLYFGVPAAAGVDLERNGTLVLGGYSTDRLQGNFTEQTYPIGDWKLERHCPWEVDVEGIFFNGDFHSGVYNLC